MRATSAGNPEDESEVLTLPDPVRPDARPVSAELLTRHIAALYREQLGRDAIDGTDSFFALGGTSMQALRVLNRIQQTVRVHARLADVYAHPAPDALAAVLQPRQSEAPTRRSLAQIGRARRAVWRPLALSQRGFYAMHRMIPEAGFANAVLVTRFTGDVDPGAVRRAVEHTARRQAALRTRFDEPDGVPSQRVAPEPPPLRELDLRTAATEPATRLDRLVRREHRTGFALAQEPAARFTLARTGDHEWALISTVHHIVFDGWSRGVLHNELVAAYRAETGDAPPLPQLPVGYVEFADWQGETLRGERLEGHLAHLAGQLRTPPPRLGDDPTGPPSYASATEPLTFPADCHDGLAELARTAGASEFSAITLAVLLTLRRVTGSARQSIAIQTANRGWPGSEDLIGCFANVSPIGCDLTGDNPHDLLAQVHAHLGTAFEHEELPLDSGLDLLGERGDPAADPGRLPQVGLALNPGRARSANLPGLRVHTEAAAAPRNAIDPTSFPLVLEFSPHAGTLTGQARRLNDHWPADTYSSFTRDLEHEFRRLSTARAGSTPWETR